MAPDLLRSLDYLSPSPFPRKGVTVVRGLRPLHIVGCAPLGRPGGDAHGFFGLFLKKRFFDVFAAASSREM